MLHKVLTLIELEKDQNKRLHWKENKNLKTIKYRKTKQNNGNNPRANLRQPGF